MAPWFSTCISCDSLFNTGLWHPHVFFLLPEPEFSLKIPNYPTCEIKSKFNTNWKLLFKVIFGHSTILTQNIYSSNWKQINHNSVNQWVVCSNLEPSSSSDNNNKLHWVIFDKIRTTKTGERMLMHFIATCINL